MTIFDLDIGLLTRYPIESQDECARFFALLREDCPVLWPEKYDTAEPIRKPFTSVEDAVVLWRKYFFWKRRKPPVEGSLFFSEENEHHGLYISCRQKDVDLDALKRFVKHLAAVWQSDLAYIYILRQASHAHDIETTVTPFRRGLVTLDLMRCLPDLPWFTVFGTPYVDLFGESTLLSAPAAHVERVDDQIVLQVWDPLRMRDADEQMLQRTVDASIKHLGADAFCKHGGEHRVPIFS